MVLMFALVCAVFSSLVWLVYAFKFIYASLGGMSFFDAGLLNVLLYTLFVCLPEFVIWMVFGFVSQHFSSRYLSRQMYKLFSQMKKNQEYSDLLARIMLETGENIRNSFMMNHFELLVADMNELLCEIVQRENLITKAQADELWSKVQSGGKWAFGKTFVESYNKDAEFKKKLLNNAISDNILAGMIMEFCARYQSLISLLEKYDKEKILLNVIETGVLGKSFSVVASISDELRKTRDGIFVEKNEEEKVFTPDVSPVPEKNTQSIINKLNPFQKEVPVIKRDKKDEFSLALERSFSSEFEDRDEKTQKHEEIEHKEPVFTSNTDNFNSENVLESQKVLNDLKKEWREIENKKDDSADTLAYPFGGWIDVDKYQK